MTMMYLKVSLSDFLTLFSARTNDGFFWSSRPSWMLLTGACISMGVSTLIACLWPANVATFWTDGIPTRGLVVGTRYKLWPLWVWIYCIVWWWIQDACKVAAFWVLRKYNLFNFNSASLVNVRGTTTFSGQGERNALARMSAGMVEGKLLEKQVERAAETVQRIAERDPQLRRASQDLASAKNAVRMARTSLSAAGGGAVKDAETGASSSAAESLARMQTTVAQIEAVAKLAPPAERAAIQAQLDAVRLTAERMAIIARQLKQETNPSH